MIPMVGFAILIAAAGGLFIRSRHGSSLAMIEGELQARGANDIAITPDWFDFDRDTLTYDVTYVDSKGQRQTNRAKVGIRPFADRSVYWQQPLPERPAGAQAR